MHNSGRMLLALYANGVLRLWNMMDARCHFKRKLGVIEEEPVSEPVETSEHEQGEAELEELDAAKHLTENDRKPI